MVLPTLKCPLFNSPLKDIFFREPSQLLRSTQLFPPSLPLGLVMRRELVQEKGRLPTASEPSECRGVGLGVSARWFILHPQTLTQPVGNSLILFLPVFLHKLQVRLNSHSQSHSLLENFTVLMEICHNPSFIVS